MRACPNCGNKLGGLRGDVKLKCKSCGRELCNRCTVGVTHKCPNCGGSTKKG